MNLRHGINPLLDILRERRDSLDPPDLPAEIGDLKAWRKLAPLPARFDASADALFCGFFRRRNVRDGPFVPVLIFEHDGRFHAWIDDIRRMEIDTDPFFFATVITEQRFLSLHEERISALARSDHEHHRVMTGRPMDLKRTLANIGDRHGRPS